MAVLIAMLRGVNVGGSHKMPMAQLRTLCDGLGFENAQTFIQSGNVVFEAVDPNQAVERLEAAIEQEFGFRSAVIVRTGPEMRTLLSKNPYVGRDEAKTIVTFLKADPGDAVREAIRSLSIGPEELFIETQEMFCYYPEGQGRSKFPMVKIERMLGVATTSRNLNSVRKLLSIAELR